MDTLSKTVAGAALCLGSIAALLPSQAWAAAAPQAPGSGPALQTVTVTATRLPVAAFDVPAAISAVPIATDSLGVNVSESLQAVPGVIANNRQNYAQDEQISIRGFGARAPFGIRGIRIYIDGIPESQPDGQGQVSEINLASAERIEVLRGPFSALYGNSSGGVIQVFTASGSGRPRFGAGLIYGSFNTRRASADAIGRVGRFGFNLGYTHFATAGSRGHSAAQRVTMQGKFDLHLGSTGELTLLGNYFDNPDAQDPLGLTRAQFEADPQGTAPAAIEFNTRKSADQRQGGAIYRLALSDSSRLRVLAYGGNRRVLQFLGIPVGAQLSPLSSGAVVDLDTGYGGAEPRWSDQFSLLGRRFTLVTGLSFDTLSQRRRGYQNFIGTTLGVIGALRRDEIDTISDFDQYLQVGWDFAPRWSLLAGARHSAVDFSSSDHFIVPGTKNNGGSVSYASTTPVAGLMYRASRTLHLYGSYGTGFETPTSSEIAYRANGAAGLNLGLLAAHTRSEELGAKWRWHSRARAQLDVFRADTSNELVVVSNVGGRSTYANAASTRRQGVELSLRTELPRHLQLQVAGTWLRAIVTAPYRACTGGGCALPSTLIPSGSRIPGVPEQDLFARLQWTAGDWTAALQSRYVSDVPADDLNNAYAGAYELLALTGQYSWRLAEGRLRTFVRIGNLLDRRYSAAVIVDASHGKYYDAGPGRSILVGVQLQPYPAG